MRERFERKYVAHDTNVCWPWLGAKRVDGYGVIRISGRAYMAHRKAFELANGRAPKVGLVIRHLCDSKDCVNPLHLAEGTQAENMADRIGKRCKPTVERLAKLAQLKAQGLSHSEIAKRLGYTHVQSVSNALRTVRRHASTA